MTVFQFDSASVFSMTDSLRNDAASLRPLNQVPVPDVWPLGQFRHAVSTAIEQANSDATLLRDEARRIAATMDLTVDAACAVDTATCHKFGATL
ncbi:hypothetical protein HMPREF2736_01245 [Corynebacterium sp. HMSC036E10]|uniref:hypothetical protein n=1 Tax=Corynebacterium sp. HMSC036E10 TaxID=1715215 RepID=UPI0008A97FDE|nr:hypothetical protein [Corynebacterium sp. HMSC036E10]OHO77579.1 hypothetical protein HMPREF2736_01245 [Corynebacterium sp. HMSC036E10]